MKWAAARTPAAGLPSLRPPPLRAPAAAASSLPARPSPPPVLAPAPSPPLLASRHLSSLPTSLLPPCHLQHASPACPATKQIVNLVSNDVRRFDDALPFYNFLLMVGLWRAGVWACAVWWRRACGGVHVRAVVCVCVCARMHWPAQMPCQWLPLAHPTIAAHTLLCRHQARRPVARHLAPPATLPPAMLGGLPGLLAAWLAPLFCSRAWLSGCPAGSRCCPHPPPPSSSCLPAVELMIVFVLVGAKLGYWASLAGVATLLALIPTQVRGWRRQAGSLPGPPASPPSCCHWRCHTWRAQGRPTPAPHHHYTHLTPTHPPLAPRRPQGLLVRYIGRLRASTAAQTDERVRLTGEVVGGVLATKMLGERVGGWGWGAGEGEGEGECAMCVCVCVCVCVCAVQMLGERVGGGLWWEGGGWLVCEGEGEVGCWQPRYAG